MLAIQGVPVKPKARHDFALSLIAIAVYLALPLERFISDSHFLVEQVQGSAKPYYHVAYLPLAQGLWQLGSGWLFDSIESALVALSSLSLGLAAGLWPGTLRRMGLDPGPALLAAALYAASPCVVMYAGAIEVHAVQALGAALAMGVATHRTGPTAARFATAVLLSLAFHLTHILFLPALWLAAAGPPRVWLTSAEARQRIGRARLPLAIAALGAIALGVSAYVISGRDPNTWARNGSLQWLGMLGTFGRLLIDALLNYGPMGIGDVAHFVRVELLIPLGLLPFGLLAIFRSSRFEPRQGALLWSACAGSIPALLVFAQGGILERGAYFLSYAPLWAGLLAWMLQRLSGRKLLPIALVAVALQLAWALDVRSEHRAQHPHSRDWAESAAELVGPGDVVLLSHLTQEVSLKRAVDQRVAGAQVLDLARRLHLVPGRHRADRLQLQLTERIETPGFSGVLWFHAPLLESTEPGLRDLAGLLESYGLKAEPADAGLMRVDATGAER